MSSREKAPSAAGSDAVVTPYQYEQLPHETSFRVVELLPGHSEDPIVCRLHVAEWSELPEYEAVSYAWGDPKDQAAILCNGKPIHVTKSLYTAFAHFRYRERSRLMWADAVCINQEDLPERGLQVKHMKRIYQSAQKVQVWLGPDNDEQQAGTAVQSIQMLSDFLFEKLEIDSTKHIAQDHTYQELLLKSRDRLPLPNETSFSSESLWKSLVWFYSHKYFTRVWVIQEISANENREINIGIHKTAWNRLDLVASYIIMEPSFSDEYGFSDAYCWWVATVAEMTMSPERWLNTLYLASNYGTLDARDVIYGLRGVMKLSNGGTLLDPNYGKTTEEVYRDAVEAALVNFKKTDVLLYVTGDNNPSWIPRWDIPMLFRNPFRFGKPMPWKPAGDTDAVWSIDKNMNILTLSGFVVGVIEVAEPYNQRWFANGTLDSESGKLMLKKAWTNILSTLSDSQSSLPLNKSLLAALAASLSFGLNHRLSPHEKLDLVRYFVAYLVIALGTDQHLLNRYIPTDLLEDSRGFDGRNFGKPVWDFDYPEASLFITRDKSVGCAIATTQKGDTVFVASGSTYPMVLRPDPAAIEPTRYAIRGFAYVDGIMDGEWQSSEVSSLNLR